MKKIRFIIVVGLLLISSCLAAQTPSFRFGVRGGFDLSKAFITDSGTSSLKPGYNVGATVEYGPYNTIFFRSGLYFTSYSTNIKNLYTKEHVVNNPTKDNNKAIFNQMSLKLPIMVAIKQVLSNSSNISYGVGPYISYGIGGKTKLETYGDIPTSEKWNTYSKNHLYYLKRFNFGGTINIDYQYRHNYVVGLGADFGFLNLINQDVNTDRNFQMLNFNVSLGYLF